MIHNWLDTAAAMRTRMRPNVWDVHIILELNTTLSVYGKVYDQLQNARSVLFDEYYQ